MKSNPTVSTEDRLEARIRVIIAGAKAHSTPSKYIRENNAEYWMCIDVAQKRITDLIQSECKKARLDELEQALSEKEVNYNVGARIYQILQGDLEPEDQRQADYVALVADVDFGNHKVKADKPWERMKHGKEKDPDNVL